MRIRRQILLLSALVLAAAPALAASDPQAITHVMKRQFDRPEAPLTVQPVVIEGDYAMAGWRQQARGGRALLRREKGVWSIVVCGGDGLLLPAALVQTGMAAPAAQKLADSAKMAEARLKPAHAKLFSTFEGIVKVDASAGGHGAHGATTHRH